MQQVSLSRNAACQIVDGVFILTKIPPRRIRRQKEGIMNSVLDVYKNLPEELKPFFTCPIDSGPCLICTLSNIIPDGEEYTESVLSKYSAPVPYKYILAHKYSIYNGHLMAEVPYDSFWGVRVGREYDSY